MIADDVERELIDLLVWLRTLRTDKSFEGASEGHHGIAMFDLAFLIEQDETLATAQVKRWADSKRIRAETIGKCPLDARRQLYRLPEILSDVAEILSLSKQEQNKLRQALTAKLRAPKSD